jgi:hypothetical protein
MLFGMKMSLIDRLHRKLFLRTFVNSYQFGCRKGQIYCKINIQIVVLAFKIGLPYSIMNSPDILVIGGLQQLS